MSVFSFDKLKKGRADSTTDSDEKSKSDVAAINKTQATSQSNRIDFTPFVNWCTSFYNEQNPLSKVAVILTLFLFPIYIIKGQYRLLGSFVSKIISGESFDFGAFIAILIVTLLIIYFLFLLIKYLRVSSPNTQGKQLEFVGVHPCIKFSYVPIHLIKEPEPVPHTSPIPVIRDTFEKDSEAELMNESTVSFMESFKKLARENETDVNKVTNDESQDDLISLFDEIRNQLEIEDAQSRLDLLRKNLEDLNANLSNNTEES